MAAKPIAWLRRSRMSIAQAVIGISRSVGAQRVDISLLQSEDTALASLL